MSFLRAASLGVFAFVAACGSLDDTSEVEQHIPGGCDDWGCGMNSPEIDHMGLHELNVTGVENTNHFYIKVVTHPSYPLKKFNITVKGATLSARSTDGLVNLTGSKLVGLLIDVRNTVVAGNYFITILEVGSTPFWAHVTGGEVTSSYLVKWDNNLGGGGQKYEWKNICTNPPQDGSPDASAMNSFHSVLFEGDRIDAHAKTVGKPEEGWFNIGCAGHALAKQHLTGHTEGAAVKYPLFKSDQDDRTANLKMFAADYCGTGKAFTISGQLLNYIDENNWMKYPVGFAGDLEAQWTPHGAACLNEPRILANPTPAGLMFFPTLKDDIIHECGAFPTGCGTTDPNAFGGNHVVSANP